jgi:hypothetical protein
MMAFRWPSVDAGLVDAGLDELPVEAGFAGAWIVMPEL